MAKKVSAIRATVMASWEDTQYLIHGEEGIKCQSGPPKDSRTPLVRSIVMPTDQMDDKGRKRSGIDSGQQQQPLRRLNGRRWQVAISDTLLSIE